MQQLPPPPFLAAFWPPARPDDEAFFARRRPWSTVSSSWPSGESLPDSAAPAPSSAPSPSGDSAAPSSPSSSSSSSRPPLLTRYTPGTLLFGFAALGFAGGVGGAFVYAMRKGRADAAREAAELAAAAAKEAAAAAGGAGGSAGTGAASTGAGAGAAGSRLRLAATKRIRPSVFDSASSSSPSVLQRAPSSGSSARAGSGPPSALSSNSSSSPSVPSASSAPRPPSAREAAERARAEAAASGPLLALQAFGIATLLVGAAALLTVEVVRRAGDIQDVDDFVLKTKRLLGSVGPPKNAAPSGGGAAEDTDGDGGWAASGARASAALPAAAAPPAPPPPPPTETLFAQLGAAETPEQWFRTLKAHLDAESAVDAAAREARVLARDAEARMGGR